jgi:hypothetical protein
LRSPAAGHSTIADCWVAFGVLTDDEARYRKGLDLYHVTVGDYLRWGRGNFRSNRIVGEVGVVVSAAKDCMNAVPCGCIYCCT